MVILDEAQAIKNPQSQVAQAAFKVDARFRDAHRYACREPTRGTVEPDALCESWPARWTERTSTSAMPSRYLEQTPAWPSTCVSASVRSSSATEARGGAQSFRTN